MKLFMCYARVDERICIQVMRALSVHDVWCDGELRIGQIWWQEILRQIEICEGFVYLLSPESIASKYCRKEYEIALSQGKTIIPILINERVKLPQKLATLQYIDLSKGLTAETTKELLNSVYLAEKHRLQGQTPSSNGTGKAVELPKFNSDSIMDDIIYELDRNHWENVIFLIDTAVRNHFTSQFIDMKRLLKDAKAALDRIKYEREAAADYGTIYALVRNPNMRKIGCDAFEQYRRMYPDYDPNHLALVCSSLQFPLLEWCDIPTGEVTLDRDDKRVVHHVDRFRISKYPVTNAQFQLFVEAPDGYSQNHWWDFSDDACKWRKYYHQPLEPRTRYGDHPRTSVSWYEAMAFCRWLSFKTNMDISLPMGFQWQRAAQGDDNRQYPWGNRFDKTRCNMRDTKKRRTTPVGDYIKGASPFGVMDMSGNSWEWCNQSSGNGGSSDSSLEPMREIRGGSFFSPLKKLRCNNYMNQKITERYPTIGFRVFAKI